MDSNAEDAARQRIEETVSRVSDRVKHGEGKAVARFVRHYYAGVAAEDLEARSVEDLYGAALSHWNFIQRREPSVAKVHVFNPRVEEHGWQSTHTIVEVVTDDMPFLIDSLGMAINELGLTNHLVIHPLVTLLRDEHGDLSRLLLDGPPVPGAITESVTHIEIDRQPDEDALARIRDACHKVLADVRIAVEDWSAMRQRMASVIERVEAGVDTAAGTRAEEAAFLHWLDDDHFTFLGYRHYTLERGAQSVNLRVVPDSGLGILRRSKPGRLSRSFAALSEAARQLALTPDTLVLTKANARSTVHRPGYLDSVGVKEFDERGEIVGEHRFIGLYTSAAYNRSPRDIPLLRHKVQAVVEGAGYRPNGHDAKALLNVLETFPRDLLFQIDVASLQTIAQGIVHLQERQRIRLFLHQDPFQRYFNCILYVPRERFNTNVRLEIEGMLAEALGAVDTEFTVWLSESKLARLNFVFWVPPGAAPGLGIGELEARIREVTRAWTDKFFDAALEHFGEARGTQLMRQYRAAFRADYRENYSPRVAVADVEHIEALGDGPKALALNLFRPLEAAPDELRFKLFLVGRSFPLSQALPMLENMGVTVQDETPSKIERADGSRVWIHDFGLRFDDASELDLDAIRHNFHETFRRVWLDEAENDGFNRMVLRAGLSWREIAILRACCKYLRQATIAFSQAYMERALCANPKVAALLVALFQARLDPAFEGEREAQCEALSGQILAALDGVANLDEDRILRSYFGLTQAMLRTNFFQRDTAGQPKAYLSFKLDPLKVAELPEPRPMYEIFVYSPQVEGVHLRGGPVARGGLRWSDREEDFRTEVLGLAKAQRVKNAVIVPVGSKGGFYPKRLPSPTDREAYVESGKAAYRTFIRGMLDITDNLVGGVVVPPDDVVRRDGDDPYLVVAADKGTATFSDIANGIALEYGFWLGDAFASGGSQGYDHKGMGITAKGAWESVKRHFREEGFDTQSQTFTVAGIGDMSGDVFGNGMLLSEHIKLVAAFNHLHIFIDPEPDPRTSLEERSRLFALPRSTWDDYDREKISAGGGVYPRSAKSITLSAAAKRALGLEQEHLTPSELIKAILMAPVDLLWNGGIGTYVKASSEHHDEVGDRANDAVRINGSELRCRVVGEGGNLGFTQRGRIEFAQNGGRIYSDAIDNSAGVDCSDHEVNIKVLLNEVVGSGDMTEKQRNALLADMTDEVGQLVLRDNYLQTQALSAARSQAPSLLEVHERLIRELERSGDLVPAIEFLPDSEEFAVRAHAGAGLTTPELSVLMAYVKIQLFQELLESNIASDPYLLDELVGYFPRALREGYRAQVERHRLSNEIICTVLANELVNRAGITGAFRLVTETGARPSHVAAAYLAARDMFAMKEVWAAVEQLDNQIPAQVQNQLLLESRKLIERACRWLLRRRPQPIDIGRTVDEFRGGLARLAPALPQLVGPEQREQIESRSASLRTSGVPEALARRAACFEDLFSGLDLVEVAELSGHPEEAVARVYFELGARLEFVWFREQVGVLPRDNPWQALARAALRDDLYSQQSLLTVDVLAQAATAAGGADGAAWAERSVEAWLETRGRVVDRCRQVLSDLRVHGHPDFTMLSVAMRELRALQVPLASPLTAARAAVADAEEAAD